MKSVAQAAAEFERKVRSRLQDWAMGEPFADVTVGVGAPTATQASADLAGFADWVSQWRDGDLGGLVEWADRKWPGLGEQRLPVRVAARSRQQALEAAGAAAEFAELSARAQRLRAWCDAVAQSGQLGQSGQCILAVRRLLPRLGGYTAADFARLLAVLDWLVRNPESGLFVRALPIEGVDTKWLEGHRGVVTELLSAATGRSDLGLRERTRLVRVRVLNGDALAGQWPAGVDDAALPLDALSRWEVYPGSTVLVVENLTSLLGLSGAEAGAVDIALAGDGKAAIDLARALPWLERCRVLYWGDLDTHGLEILGRFRELCPHAESVLMDAKTLQEYLHLSVPEPVPSPAHPESLPWLRQEERAVMQDLFRRGVRLEQERVPWPVVHAGLRTAQNT